MTQGSCPDHGQDGGDELNGSSPSSSSAGRDRQEQHGSPSSPAAGPDRQGRADSEKAGSERPPERGEQPQGARRMPRRPAQAAGFADGASSDVLAPGPDLAGQVHAVTGGDGAALGTLTEAEVLGVIAASRRLASWAAWAETVALAEFGQRRAAPGEPPGTDRGAADEVGWKTRMTWLAAANRMARACSAAGQLPCTLAALRNGLIDPGYVMVIADYTSVLGPGDVAEADRLLAAAAPHKTYGELRAAAARLVMRLDPDAVRRRKEEAAKRDAHVRLFREDTGNAALSARELPAVDALASWQHIQQRALDLRAAGVEGSLRELCVLAMMDLLQERDTRDTLSADPGTSGTPDDQRPPEDCGPHDAGSHGGGPAGGESPGDSGQDDHSGPGGSGLGGGDDDWPEDDWPDDGWPEEEGPEDEWPGNDGEGPGGPGRGPGDPEQDGPGMPPSGTARPGAGDGRDGSGGQDGNRVRGSRGSRGGGTRLAAQPVIVIPWEALGGGPAGPAQIPGFGLVDPDSARDLLAAACRDPQTRICVTVLGPDGTARLHGCAPGRPDPGTFTAERANGPPGGDPPAPPDAGPPGAGPPGSVITAAELIRRLRVRLAPVARDGCDHANAEAGYTPSRRLAHLIKARNATCTAPGCGAAAAGCDLDHTIAWDKGGITCECDLAPLCRHHHRVKQSSGWQLEQPEPGRLTWRTPAGLEYATRPTNYRAD